MPVSCHALQPEGRCVADHVGSLVVWQAGPIGCCWFRGPLCAVAWSRPQTVAPGKCNPVAPGCTVAVQCTTVWHCTPTAKLACCIDQPLSGNELLNAQVRHTLQQVDLADQLAAAHSGTPQDTFAVLLASPHIARDDRFRWRSVTVRRCRPRCLLGLVVQD
jgi:hypothetical protein